MCGYVCIALPVSCNIWMTMMMVTVAAAFDAASECDVRNIDAVYIVLIVAAISYYSITFGNDFRQQDISYTYVLCCMVQF